MMSPKEVVKIWCTAFNEQNTAKLEDLYSDDAINYQVADTPIQGKRAIGESFAYFFKAFPDVGFDIVNLFEDGEWAMLEWNGWGTQKGEFAGCLPSGKRYELQGCGFFHIKNGKIVFQRGYWDKITWFKQIGIPFQ